MGSDELLFTLVTAGLILMFVWWLFKSGTIWIGFLLGAIGFFIYVLNSPA